MSTSEIKEVVREKYAEAALRAEAGRHADSGNAKASCKCGDKISSRLYDVSQIGTLPEKAVLASLGCGNPTALAELKAGETVLDLGSGGGIDVLLSARRVGPAGKAFGLDMTDEMLALANENKSKSGLTNVEFFKGDIENIPLPDGSVDVIISNCVINLSADKDRVFREAFRVLKHGGRLAVSDTVASAPIPDELKADLASYSACVTSSASVDDLRSMLSEAGFRDIRIRPREESRQFIRDWSPDQGVENFILSASIEAVK